MDNINKIIVSALKPIGLPVAERLYEGKKDEYIVFNLTDDRGQDFGDDRPHADVAYLHVHYICPWSASYHDKRRQIRQALFDAGATWPEVSDLSDEAERVRHFVFEFEIENLYELEGI